VISDTWSFVSIGIVFKLAVSFLFPKGDTASIQEIQAFQFLKMNAAPDCVVLY